MKHYITSDENNGFMEWSDLDGFGGDAPEIMDNDSFMASFSSGEFIATIIENEELYSYLKDTYGITDRT